MGTVGAAERETAALLHIRRLRLAGRPTAPVQVDYAVSEAKPCGGC